MELCSGDGPTRRKNMCKTTNDPVGIPVSLPSVLPPIENWYVVARKKNTGTCSIYSSWADYQAETKHPRKNALSSPAATEKTKKGVEDAEKHELAAFPTMTQAITYLNVIGRRSPESVKSSAFIPSVASRLSTDSRYGSTIAGGRIIPSHLPPKESKSSLLQGTTGANIGGGSTQLSPPPTFNPTSHVSHPQKRLRESATKTIQVVDEDSDCHSESSNDTRTAKHTESPSPIFSTPFKKRKVEIEAKQSRVPIFKRGLSMSKTSETIDIGAPKRSTPDMSSLDALAIAASASGSKKSDKSKASQVSKTSGTESEKESRNAAETVTAATATATTPNGNRGIEGVRLSSSGVIPKGVIHSTSPRDILRPRLSQLPNFTMGRLENSGSPSIGASNNSTKQQQQIIQKQKALRQHQEQQTRQRSSLIIPTVPGNLASSLKIPEVPRGFVPAEQSHDRIWRAGMDLTAKKINPNISSVALQSSNPNYITVPNRFSNDPYSAKHFHQQMPHLPQHLQGIPQAAMYRIPPHPLSLQLQPSYTRINHHHLLGSGAYAQQLLRTIETASNASATSEGDHSEITIKCHNGHPQVVSSPIGHRHTKSPLSLGTIYTTQKSDSPAPAKRDHRDS